MSIQLYSSPMKYKDPNTGNYIDIIGISGNPGRGISSVELNNDYTLTITFTDGTSTTTNSIRGAQGVGIQSVEKTNTSGLVDTYTITFDDNTISTFQVTNGASIDLHICAQGEYDSTTRVPTIQSPDSRTFYLVPNEDSAASNAYTEWLYANGAWERFGAQVIDLSGYATKADTVLETTLSRGRKAESTVGEGSFAFGLNVEASGQYSNATGQRTAAIGNNSHAEGRETSANGSFSHAEGRETAADGTCSHAEGRGAVSSGSYAHAEGWCTIASGFASHAEGKCNISDSHSNWPEWVANTEYVVGDKVKLTITNNDEVVVKGYICLTPNNDAEFTAANWLVDTKMNYVHIVGNGSAPTDRSNAYALDWDGNGHYMGDVYVGANADSSGGTKVATIDDIQQVATLEEVEEIITSYEEDEDMIFEMTFKNQGHGEGEYTSVDTTETIMSAYAAGKHVVLRFPEVTDFTYVIGMCLASITGASVDEGKAYCNTVLNGQPLTEITLGSENISVSIVAHN